METQENASHVANRDVYIVHNENTLGYSHNYSPDKVACTMVVMAIDYMRGGEPTTIDRMVSVSTANARLATKKDFERFGVIV